jgi:hypothetical protein
MKKIQSRTLFIIKALNFLIIYVAIIIILNYSLNLYTPIGVNENADMSRINYIAHYNANTHKYIAGFFDCTEFSSALVKSLKKSGINSYCVSGYFNESGDLKKHTWTEFVNRGEIYNIEATSGKIFQNKSEYIQTSKGKCP